MDNKQNFDGLYELALFAGAGGGILGGKLLGWRTVCAVERDLYAASVLAQRQNDGCLEPFPVWSDVSAFRSDNPECAGIIEQLRRLSGQLVISGGFPCQDISIANSTERKGLNGERSGLWGEMCRIIGEIRPQYAFVENSPELAVFGLNRVFGDFAEMGYCCRSGALGGGAIGALQEGERLWIVATKTNGAVLESVDTQKHIKPRSEELRRREFARAVRSMLRQDDYTRIKRDTNGVSIGMDRLKAIGNAQFPKLAATAWRFLSE